MGLKYYSKELNNYSNIPPLSSDIDLPLYANTCVSYNKKHQYSSQASSSLEEAYTSLQHHDGITYHLEKNVYANITKLSSDTSDDAKYGSLIHTKSIIPESKTDITLNSQILDENNNNRIYENVKLGPKSSLSYQKSSSNNVSSSSSSPIYINLKQDEDKPPIISARTTPLLKTNQKEDIRLSSIHLIEIKQVDIETNVLEKRSNTKTKQTVKKSEANIIPNCNDKSDLYRTKIPSTITRILPSLRQRRTSHRPRRYRRRSSTPFRTILHSNSTRRQQQQHSNSNTCVHHPMIRQKRSSNKSVSNQLYNEFQQSILSDNQSINSFYTEEIVESPMQFHKTLQNEILGWYPTENVLIPQICSTSENGESIQQDETANEGEEEKEAKEEELCPHNTFEDFLLRRPPKSSCSTLASVTNTLISETISQKIPVQPPPPPLPPLKSHSSGIALGLDKKDKDFIHNIIHRTNGDQRVSNRITALREAYIRAENKRNDLLKTQQILQIDQNKNKKKITRRPSLIASKIRNELEKYDELPVHRRRSFDDDDDDDDDIDDTYSANDGYRYCHRRLPPVPSPANRIINFIITLKRQLQKNFHDIRSRILIEAMENSSRRRYNLHNSSGPSHRHRSRPKTSYSINRHSIEYPYSSRRHEFSRSHSARSQIHSYHHLSADQRLSYRPRTFRVTPDLDLQRRQRMN